MRIYLTDNNCRQSGIVRYYRKDVSSLYHLAGKTVAQLCRENANLLIFPYCLKDTNDRIGESSVISLQNTEDEEKVVITTGNIMGFIGTGGIQIKIQSRFDKGRDDFFLHYMLQKVLSFNLFDLNHSNEQEDVFDFALFMFPYFLKNALRRGIYREYRCYKHNDANIKGVIDFGRHIASNIPLNGNFAYSTREYSYDNNLTQLIRHTIEYMKTTKYGTRVLNMDYDTIGYVKGIIEYTPTYNKNDREYIISKNLRHKIHPYYTEYHPLRTLCLQILKMEGIKYGEREEEISGILFDGAWLWEEYVNTILCQKGFLHPENRNKKGRIFLFEDNTGYRYPDFYKKGIVLDAKYKRIGSYTNVADVDRDDIHQIITYIACLQANKGGFVSPLEHKLPYVPSKRIKGLQATLSIFGIEISKNANSYADFCQEMEKKENDFIESLDL